MGLNDGPPSNRQIKVLKFFGRLPSKPITKGEASGIVTAIFRDAEKKCMWNKYVYLTGDTDNDSQDLKRFDVHELLKTEVPGDWQPPHKTPSRKPQKKECPKEINKMVRDILKEGIPFDDNPETEIEYEGKTFCLTGTFSFGDRKECVDVITGLGGIVHENIRCNTDYLIVGGKAAPFSIQGFYGEKIFKAVKRKLQGQAILFISEDEWVKTL